MGVGVVSWRDCVNACVQYTCMHLKLVADLYLYMYVSLHFL